MPVPEDIYKQDIDFTALALQYPNFARRLKPNLQLNFSDPESVRQLTKALLHRDFNLNISLPEDRLCPPVPNRFNYIVFAQRLIDSTRPDYRDGPLEGETLIGLDIGTGASAIYPMIACRQRSSWAFLSTEIDAKSRSFAENNVKSNDLQNRIKIVETDLSGQRILPTTVLQRFDDYGIRIQITNPPFYTSKEEMLSNAAQKSRPPNSACTGSEIEMICPGGEVAFVTRLIDESAMPLNRSKIQWFSSMLGKFSSVATIISHLQDGPDKCTNYAITEFVQGQKTRRWCVAWTWHSLRPPTSLVRSCPALEKIDKKLFPFPSDLEVEVQMSARDLGQLVNSEISKLDLKWHWSHEKMYGIGQSIPGDVWSRKARRSKGKQQPVPHQHDSDMKDVDDVQIPFRGHHSKENKREDDDDNDADDDGNANPAFAFRITISPSSTTTKSANTSTTSQTTRIQLRWLQGHDHVIFESFCGWLKRKIGT